MNSGKKFEQDFRKSIPENIWYYRLRDSPASFGQGTQTRFATSNICDCILFGNSTLFLCELKSHKGKSLPFNCVRQNQIEQMQKAAKFDCIIPALVIFFPDVERCFAIHIYDFVNLVDASKKKSANVSEFAENGFEIGVTKLKTHYRYDVEKMMRDLKEDLYG